MGAIQVASDTIDILKGIAAIKTAAHLAHSKSHEDLISHLKTSTLPIL